MALMAIQAFNLLFGYMAGFGCSIGGVGICGSCRFLFFLIIKKENHPFNYLGVIFFIFTWILVKCI